MLKNFFTFSRFTLFIALCISAIAAWYSVIGLTAIFAGAVIPIIIMGGILEIAKITTTVWLHRYWDRAGLAIKTYLTIAVIALACLTSMGIFGLLSKAHLDQNVPAGDVAAQVALIDEKIKTQRDNIDTARRALQQMDAQVDARLSRGDSENSAERAVQIRRQQAKERAQLQADIATAQKEISKLNEERAPIASKLRKVEAEVGPVKYIAALIYGDNPDQTLLEKAVRWVTIMIVMVFDPLAIVLILAANNSIKWDKMRKDDEAAMGIVPPTDEDTRKFTEEELSALDKTHMTSWPDKWQEWSDSDMEKFAEETFNEVAKEEETHKPLVSKEESEAITDGLAEIKEPTFKQGNYIINTNVNAMQLPVLKRVETQTLETKQEEDINKEPVDIKTEGVTTEVKLTDDMYVSVEGKNMSIAAAKGMGPQYAEALKSLNQILWGTKFPPTALKGDVYTRIDVIPHQTYKFNGTKWIKIDRMDNTSYLQNTSYIQLLISKLEKGEYDPELLTDAEQEEISNYLKRST